MMDLPPIDSVPLRPLTFECIAEASDKYEVPEALLFAILRKEGGRTGQAVKNKNGSFDLGPAQINTSWLETLAKYGITRSRLKNDGCLNVQVSSWILATHYHKSRDWTLSVIHYHTGPNAKPEVIRGRGTVYARDVIKMWHQYHDVSKDFNYSPVEYYSQQSKK